MTRTVLCFGDSNTHGSVPLEKLGMTRRFERNERWPGVLANSLGETWHLIEEGHSGRTTLHDDPIEGPHRNGLKILPALLESHRPIDLVILMLGTNDLKSRFSVTPIEISLSVERLITLTKGSNSSPKGLAPEVLLVSPVPITEEGVLKEVFAGGAQKSDELSDLFEQVAKRNGCSFLNAGSVAKTDPIDGVHLSKEAHLAIAKAIYSKMESDFL